MEWYFDVKSLDGIQSISYLNPDNSTPKPISCLMNTVLNLPPQTNVQLIPHAALIQGNCIEGRFHIEGTGTLDFVILNYDVPESDPTGGPLIKIDCDGEELCSFHPKDVKLPCGPQEKYLMSTFLVALAAAEGKITGVAINDPVPFPLPDELRARSGLL